MCQVRAVWFRTDEGHKRNRLDIYLSMLDQARRLATDPSQGLVFIHWSFPHKPNIYDRTTQDFKLGKKLSYLDNLALVDRTVGELRREMESAGVWEDTILLITSDHSLRGKNPSAKFPHVSSEDAAVIGSKPDPRVPFLLKLRGQRQAVTYEPAFNTVVTNDLLLALMRGELTSADNVVGWLEEHRSTAENPHKRNQRR